MENGYFDFNGQRGLPTRFVKIGDTFERYGTTLKCVRRRGDLLPKDACKGCWFKAPRDGYKKGEATINCNDIQCSSWDRRDRKNVWFIEKQAPYGETGIEENVGR